MPGIPLQAYTVEIEALIRQDRQDEAAAHCQQILQLYPKHVRTLCLLGRALFDLGEYDDSGKCFQQALSVDPENAWAWFGLAEVYDERGMLAEAIWPMERAYELATGEPAIRYELETLYSRRDGPHPPRLGWTRNSLGRFYAAQGMYAKAIVEYRASMKANPDLPDVWVGLAAALWHEGHRQQAADESEKILEALPDCLKANLILGHHRVQAAPAGGGEAQLRAANALDPENLTAVRMMGPSSPLTRREALVPELDWGPPAGTRTEESSVALHSEPTMESDTEQGDGRGIPEPPPEQIPRWLRELQAGEE